jgi:hypothetical protein
MKNVKTMAVAGTMGAVVATGGFWALNSGSGATKAENVANDNSIVGVTTGGLESGTTGAGGTGAQSGGGSGTQSAAAPDRPSATTQFARGRGPFTHQSDEVYVTFEGQETCLRGKAWSMVAVFHVRDVTATRAYVSKIVATYRAPVTSKRVTLGVQQFYQADGKQLLRNDVANIGVMPAGGKWTQTHVVNSWVSFAKGPATFQRKAQIGQAPGTKEAVWCGGTGGLQIKVRPH